MRLWHSKLIPMLDGKRLCDLHMSCCNLRGRGWGKRNVAINYLYDDPLGEEALAAYHKLVLQEMAYRGYKFTLYWLDPCYCGKNRAARRYNHKDYGVALSRNVPLKGHNLNIFLNDVEALIERGLPLDLSHSTYTTSLGKKYTTYKVIKEDIQITYMVEA